MVMLKKLFHKLRNQNEDGAVSVDWVMMTGGAVLLGLVVWPVFNDMVAGQGQMLDEELSTIPEQVKGGKKGEGSEE